MTATKKRQSVPPPSSESRAADLVTVVWMLHFVTAFACQVVGALARLAYLWLANHPLLGMLAGFMLLASLVAGTITLLLIPVVLRMRRAAPPTGILIVAIAVGLLPWMTLLYQSI